MQIQMEALIDFSVISSNPISAAFLSQHIKSFAEATNFVKQLPYSRNTDKLNLTTVFTDNCGTCSTKHALLKQLANENNFMDLQLIMGIFKMNGNNTPKVSDRLKAHKLEYIPEAHCYLKYKDEIMDFTKPNSKPADFLNDLIEEIEIEAVQITVYKVEYHRHYLQQWLNLHDNIHLTLDELWQIREDCIHDLSL